MERASKYHAKRTQAGGRIFDSKREAARYQELILLMRAGEITNIECQVPFLLQEKFKKNGKSIREINYIADFVVTYKDGHIEVEDVKGVRTEVYRLKKKLFEKRYPELTIKEIV